MKIDFIDSFKEHNWKFLTFSSIERLSGFSKPTIKDIESISSSLK